VWAEVWLTLYKNTVKDKALFYDKMCDMFIKDIEHQNAAFYSRYFIEVAEEEITFKDLIIKYLLWITKKGTASIYYVNTTATLSVTVDTADTLAPKESNKISKNSGQKNKEQKKCLMCDYLGHNFYKCWVINNSNCLKNWKKNKNWNIVI